MNKNKAKAVRHARRKIGIRKRIVGTPERPRLAIYRSLNHTYAQVIDDMAGITLASASTRDKGIKIEGSGGNVASAKAVGAALAERAKKAGVEAVVFDRGGFKFHGRVKAFADAARESGLQF
ncbi:MAG: 50S ribosomal protein L18 [Phycisphaerales bacterium]